MNTDQLNQILCEWLLSSEQVPADLAETLIISSIRSHRLDAWRFQGMWRRAYEGQIGRFKDRHQVIQREELTPGGDRERIIEGTQVVGTELILTEVDGVEEKPFDVVAIEGPCPVPPGPGWARKRARRAVGGWAEQPLDEARWKQLGAPLVIEEADRTLRQSLGSPERMDQLTIDGSETPAAQSHAAVVFWVIEGSVADKPLRGVVGPDGATWGDAPRSLVPTEAASEASARVLLFGAGYALAAVIGLFVFIVPGLIVGAIGALHVRHLLGARQRLIEARRVAQESQLTAMLAEHLVR